MRSPGEFRHNLARAILLLRSQKATSRSSLSKAVGVAASTGGLYVDLLIEAGYASESGLEQGPMGRPKRALTLRPEAGWFAGVEFHAAHVQAVRVDFAGQPVERIEQALPDSPLAQSVIETIVTCVRTLEANATGPLLAIGIGAPGLVDPLGGVGREYRFIAQWRDVAVVEALRARFAAPVALENNLRTVALAERWFGGGRDLADFVCLGLRSGFGAGIVAGGKLLSGAQHTAGEIGRWPWPAGGDEPTRKLEESLSAPEIFRRVNGLAARTSVPSDLHAAFAKFTPPIRRDDAIHPAWRPVIEELAQVLACLHLLLNPSAFFLHGPLTATGAAFTEGVVQTALTYGGGTEAAPLRFLASTLGTEAGALGAAGLAMEQWAPELKSP